MFEKFLRKVFRKIKNKKLKVFRTKNRHLWNTKSKKKEKTFRKRFSNKFSRRPSFLKNFRNLRKKIPDFKGANFLIRVPLAIVFILQGLSKLPLNISDAESYGLPMTVWFFVAWGELLSGFGLLIGGLLITKKLNSYGGLITRFCGIVICGIMTGIILMQEPDSLLDVLLYDNFHVMLYCGGLFFALIGNRVYLGDIKKN